MWNVSKALLQLMEVLSQVASQLPLASASCWNYLPAELGYLVSTLSNDEHKIFTEGKANISPHEF